MKAVKMLIGVAVCLAVVGMAYAAVVVDDEGVGFVGKGDVQSLFGWNNAELQANAGAVDFWFSTSGQWEWECEWWTGPDHNRKRHTTDHSLVALLDTSIAFDARANKKGQITGFNLNGFDPDWTASSGTVPGTCDASKSLVADSLKMISEGDEGTLWVEWSGTRFALPMPIDQGE